MSLTPFHAGFSAPIEEVDDGETEVLPNISNVDALKVEVCPAPLALPLRADISRQKQRFLSPAISTGRLLLPPPKPDVTPTQFRRAWPALVVLAKVASLHAACRGPPTLQAQLVVLSIALVDGTGSDWRAWASHAALLAGSFWWSRR